MDVLHLARELVASADLIVTDRDDHSLILVEAKVLTNSREAAIATLLGRIERFSFPYGMYVDPQVILIHAVGCEGPLATLETPVALRAYDQNFDNVRISVDYLAIMIASWLADLASTWRHPEPPYKAELAEAGLLGRLEGARFELGKVGR